MEMEAEGVAENTRTEGGLVASVASVLAAATNMK
jgi:hypothetical protein